MGKSKDPKQIGNATSVVTFFGGVPCAVETYENDAQALKRYRKLKEIEIEIIRQQENLPAGEVRAEETVEPKTRGVRTSCSGLPRCTFTHSRLSLAVVRGPMYAAPKAPMAYVAVLKEGGDLNVVGFECSCEAQGAYARIRESHEKGDPSFEESGEGFTKSFSTDEFSAQVGIAEVVPRGGDFRIV